MVQYFLYIYNESCTLIIFIHQDWEVGGIIKNKSFFVFKMTIDNKTVDKFKNTQQK